MRLITIFFVILFCNCQLFAQNNDLFYKSTKNEPVTNNNIGPTSSVNQGQKPFYIGLGDALGIGFGYKINIGNNFSFGPGIHFGSLQDEYESYSLLKVSGLFRYKPKNAYLKFGPYFTFPVSSNYDSDMEEVLETPGILLGCGYEFKNGFEIGVVQNIDLFFLDFDSPLFFVPLLSVGYQFGSPKYTKSAQQAVDHRVTPNYNLQPQQETVVAPPPPSIDYSKYTDEELKKLLDKTTSEENYSEANNIQNEITQRAEQNKFAKLSDEELKKQLELALKAEDYKKAEAIQKELDKRVSLKKGKTNNTNTKQPTKKTIKELEEDLKKAMEAEDYKKADEIQKEINKLKNP
jgi:hypothetical protein